MTRPLRVVAPGERVARITRAREMALAVRARVIGVGDGLIGRAAERERCRGHAIHDVVGVVRDRAARVRGRVEVAAGVVGVGGETRVGHVCVLRSPKPVVGVARDERARIGDGGQVVVGVVAEERDRRKRDR